jgi:hypothetical protein
MPNLHKFLREDGDSWAQQRKGSAPETLKNPATGHMKMNRMCTPKKKHTALWRKKWKGPQNDPQIADYSHHAFLALSRAIHRTTAPSIDVLLERY